MADGTVVIDIILDDGTTASGIANVDKSMQGLGGSAETANISIGTMLKSLGLMKLAQSGFDMIKNSLDGAINRYDTLNNSEKVFQNMGFDAAQTTPMMDNLLKSINGLPTPLEDAVQGVQGIANATGDLDKSEKIYSALNNSILGVGKSGTEVNSAIEMLSRGLNKGEINGHEFNTLMQTMGPNLNAVADEMGLTTEELQKGLSDGSVSVDEFTDMLIHMDSEGGGKMASFQKQAQDMTAGISTNMANLKTAIARNMANIIGAVDEGLQAIGLPTIGEAISIFADKVNTVLGSIAEAIPPLIKQAKEIYDVMEPWLPLIGAIAGAVVGMITAWNTFNTVKETIDKVKKSWDLLSGVLMMNPWILAVGAAIAAAILIYTYWDEIKVFFTNLWEWLKETGAKVWDSITDAWSDAVESIKEMWSGITGFFSDLWEGIKSVALAIWEPIVAKWNEVVEKFQADWAMVKEFFSQLWEGIKEIAMTIWEPIQAMWDEVSEYFSEVWNDTVEYFTELWDEVSSYFIELWTEISEKFSEIWSGIKEFFAELWEGIVEIALAIWEPIVEKWHEIIQTVIDIFTPIIAFFVETWEKVKATSMELWDSLKSWLIDTWNSIKDRAISIFESLKSFIENTWKGIKIITEIVWGAISLFFETIWNVIKITFETVLEVIKTILTAMWDVMKIITEQVWEAIKLAIEVAWENIKTVVDTVMTVIKTIIDTIWNVIKGIIDTVMNLIKGDISGAWESIKGIIETVMNGISTIISTIWGAIKTIVSTNVEAIKTVVSDTFNSLKDVVSIAWTNVTTAISTGVTAGLKVVSDAKSKFLQAGKDLISGLIEGIKNMAGAAIDAITGVVDGVVNTAKSFLKIKSPSRVFKEIGNFTVQGLADGINEKRTVATHEMEAIVSDMKWNTQKLNKEINQIQKKANAEEKQLIKRTNEDIAKIRKTERSAKKKNTAQMNISIRRQQEDMNAKLVSIRSKRASDILKIQEEQFKLENAADKEQFETMKQFIDDSKQYQEYSLVQQYQDWVKIQEAYIIGTEERSKAEKEALAVKKQIHNELTAINNQYLADVTALNESLIAEENRLNDAYASALDSRAESYRGFAGLFDSVGDGSETSKDELMGNLQDQVDAMVKWVGQIETLAIRGIDDGLLEELRQMGPKARNEMEALNKMTDEELTEYTVLWQSKNNLARKQAERELVGMKEDTKKQIDEITSETERQLRLLNIIWISKTNEIRKGTEDEFNILEASLEDIGENSIQGLMNGLESMRGPLMATAQSIADAVKETMSSAFDIHSPSRWMRDYIGGNMIEGWIDGIDTEKSKVMKKSKDMASWMKPKINGRLNDYGRNGGNVTKTNSTSYGDTNITIVSPENTPSENARQIKRVGRELAYGY